MLDSLKLVLRSCQPQMKKRSENLCQLSKISDNSQIISCAFLKKTEINISKCYFTRGKCVMSSKRFHWLNSLANLNNLLIFLLAREIGLHFRSYFGIYFLTLKYIVTDRQTDKQTNIHTCMYAYTHTHTYIYIYT